MPDKQKKRLFIAFNLPDYLKDELNAFLLGIREKYTQVKWVNNEILHIILHFLGDIDEELEEKIKIILNDIEGKFSEIKLKFTEIDCFPSKNNPRIIYLGCQQTNGDSTQELYKILADKLAQIHIKTDLRPWHPHITLGRVKFGQINLSNLPQIKNQEEFRIDSVDLMESHLKPAGAEYSLLLGTKL